MIELLTITILILGFAVAAITFLHAYRPHIGVSKIERIAAEKTNSLKIKVTIVNAGNTPAYNVTAFATWSISEHTVEFIPNSIFIILPNTVYSGEPTFSSEKEIPLEEVSLKILVEYSAPPLLFNCIERKFKFNAQFKFEGNINNPKIIPVEMNDKYIF